jgi:hypothetical protein
VHPQCTSGKNSTERSFDLLESGRVRQAGSGSTLRAKARGLWLIRVSAHAGDDPSRGLRGLRSPRLRGSYSNCLQIVPSALLSLRKTNGFARAGYLAGDEISRLKLSGVWLRSITVPTVRPVFFRQDRHLRTPGRFLKRKWSPTTPQCGQEKRSGHRDFSR